MKRPPTKQKSFKSYLEALNSSLKNAVAACRAEDTGPGYGDTGTNRFLGSWVCEGLRFHVAADTQHCGCLGSGKSGLGKGCHPSELTLSGLRSWTHLSKQAHYPHHFKSIKIDSLFPFKTNFICISNRQLSKTLTCRCSNVHTYK